MNRVILSVLLMGLAAIVIACGGGGASEAPRPREFRWKCARRRRCLWNRPRRRTGGSEGSSGDPYANLPEINLSPTGSDALDNPDFNFDRTPLVTGVDTDRVEIKLQFACHQQQRDRLRHDVKQVPGRRHRFRGPGESAHRRSTDLPAHLLP